MNRPTIKQRLLSVRRKLALSFGNPEYCRVGRWSLVEGLYAGKAPGVFFEAGAHDGWTSSNTYWLEASMGWRGVLVEPVPDLYKACAKERKLCKVFHGALVSNTFAEATVEIECSGLVSAVVQSPMLQETRDIANSYYGVSSRPKIAVPALTIDACLGRSGISQVDFVSLDVEGFEAQALRGMDLDRWRPQWMLVECNDFEEVMDVLRPVYEAERNLPPKDVLFRRLEGL